MGLAFTYFEPKAIKKEQAPSHFLPKSKAQVWKGKDVSLSLNKKRGKTLNHGGGGDGGSNAYGWRSESAKNKELTNFNHALISCM